MSWKKLRRTVRVTLAIALLIVLSIVGLFITTSFTPAPFITILQNAKMVEGEVNAFKPKEAPANTLLSDGTLLISDIQYGKEYPNSFLDIYISENKKDSRRPTIIFMHGGGFAWGDKTVGNPKIDEETPHYLRELAKRGFNVVSVNYALTPEYQYPVPLLQLNEAMQFLQQHGKKYGLADTDVVFMGQSAGGQLVGQYVNIQTNPQYAEEMGMQSTLDPKAIKAVVFNSALLDANRMDRTGDALTNYLFNALGRSYFDTDDLMEEPSVDQSNVIKHINSKFPPTFITDGNHATFTEQAKDLDKRMDELKIPHEFNYYNRKTAKLKHGYESLLTNQYAKENMEKMLAFLNTHVGSSTSS